MAALQQVAAIDAQFLSQVTGRRALGDAAQDEDDGRTRGVALGQMAPVKRLKTAPQARQR